MTVQPAKPTPIKIGIIIESFLQPRWVRKSLEQALATGLCTFSLVVKVKPKKDSGSLLYKLYDRMDRRLFPTDAIELVSVEDLFSEATVIEDADKITEFELDLLINFASYEWNHRVSKRAKHGVWFYAFGDSPGFEEVMNQVPITHSSLRSLKGETEQIVYSSASPTLSRFSAGLNNNTCYWKSAAFVARALRGAQEEGTNALSFNRRAGITRVPGNAAMSRMFLKLSGRIAARAVEKFSYSEQWILAYRFDRDEFRYLIPPVGRFWADPFQIKVNGRYYIFFEDYVNAAGRAHISVVEVDQNGIVSGPTEVLKLDCHLSYPFVFEWRGDYFMIPETGDKNVVELYRSVSFPFEWQPAQVLLEAKCPLDTTLIEVNGTWWMFVNIQEEGVKVNWDELHLYYSDSPLGPWKPHARNPVVSDVRSARPAGRLFWSDNVLYRPSQDSSMRYGYATTINRITSLSPTEYSEAEVSKILPDWDKDILGVHTLNVVDGLTVIDCLTKRSRFRGGKLRPPAGLGMIEDLLRGAAV